MAPVIPFCGGTAKAVIPLHWQIFIGHRPKKYRTSHKNIGFIGHMYVSVLNLYTSAFLLCMSASAAEIQFPWLASGTLACLVHWL